MSFINYLKDLLLKKVLKIEDGRIKMFNKLDYIMFPAPGMAEFLQKIGKDKGDDYLYDLGYKAGNDGADEIIEKLSLLNKPIPTNLSIILTMFETLGFGKMDIKILKPEQGKVLINVTNHPVIDYAKLKFGKDSRVCSHYRGIFSIHAQREIKVKDCKLVETQCICKGTQFCEWSSGIFREK